MDYASIVASAVTKVLTADEQKVPAFERRMIPDTLIPELAKEIGAQAATDIAAAQAGGQS
jgi:hypothetical protein